MCTRTFGIHYVGEVLSVQDGLSLYWLQQESIRLISPHTLPVASAAFMAGVTMKQVLNTASWSSANILKNFYHRREVWAHN